MSVVTRPFTGFHINFSNEPPNHTKLVRLSESDRVRDEPTKVAPSVPLPDETDTFTLGVEPQAALVEAPRLDIGLEAESPREETWAPLEVEKTLGQLMTEARKYRGVSREDAAEQTSIPAYYIRMIESDCYDAIPDQLYLLPFFQRYAIFLGIDAQQVVARFIRDFEKAESEIVAPASPKKAAPKAVATNGMNRWRRVAEAAAIVGILLPLAGWEIGKMRVASHRNSTDSNIAAISTTPRSLSSVPPSSAPPPAVAPVSAPPQETVASAAPGKAVVSSAAPAAPDQIASAPQTPTRSRHHARSHRLTHHSRHLKRGIS